MPGVSAEALQSYIEEAERGYDVDSLPSIPNPISPSHIVPADLIEKISERAARDNVSAEQIIRRALEQYLKSAQHFLRRDHFSPTPSPRHISVGGACNNAGMTPSTTTAPRAELHKTIWRIANDLRGTVDGWDFKAYVLGFLFYRFISEHLTNFLNEQERAAGNSDFDYAKISDEEAEWGRGETVSEKGFFILPSELFANVRSRAQAG